MGESEEVRREREGRRGRDRQEVVQCISHPRPSFQYRFLVHVGFFVRDTGVLHPREHKGGQQPIKGVPLDNSKARPSRLRPRVKNLYATSGGAGEKEAKGLSLSKHSFPAGRCYPTQFSRGSQEKRRVPTQHYRKVRHYCIFQVFLHKYIYIRFDSSPMLFLISRRILVFQLSSLVNWSNSTTLPVN